MKAERKRLRKEGLLGHDNSGLIMPGEIHRDTVGGEGSIKPASERTLKPNPEPPPGTIPGV